MVEPKVVTAEKFAVMPQPSANDVEQLSSMGYKSIINNRPDNEQSDQPSASEVREVARQKGLHYEHMPVTLDSITRDDVLAFRQAVTLAPPPVVAHCRTGKRSFLLWAAGEVIDGDRSADELVKQAQELDIDAKELPQLLDRIS